MENSCEVPYSLMEGLMLAAKHLVVVSDQSKIKRDSFRI
jgi:hypothetical protein